MPATSLPCPACGSALKIPDESILGRKVKCPKCSHVFRLEISASAPPAEAPDTPPQPTGSTLSSTDSILLPPWQISAEAPSIAEKLQTQRRKRQRNRWWIGVVSAGMLLVCGSVGLFAWHAGKAQPPALAESENKVSELEETDSETEAPLSWEMPTAESSQPIQLQYIPAGARIVIHLRPAELWQRGSRGEELGLCLGPITEFIAAKIRELSKQQPAQISEALFCLIPGERGTPPDVAAVFHLREDAKRSKLLDEIGGQHVDEGNSAYYRTGEWAYLLPDLKTIAVCPVGLAGEMISAIQESNATSTGIDELLRLTDRSRPITVVFEPTATRIDADQLFPATAIPLWEQFLDWLGPEADAAAWSLAWQNDIVWSELVVRNRGGQQAEIVERQLRRQLDKLPLDVLKFVEQLLPQEPGKRQIMGRFPAMTKAVSLATRTTSGPRFAKLVTRLPERAAPNLALGTLFTWDESTRASGPGKSQPSDMDRNSVQFDSATLAEKLQRKITVEFNREPLQGAFAYIANEIKTKIEIDGDALKLAGYTKNMPQTFSLENVSASTVIRIIVEQPMQNKLCLVVDEPARILRITTLAAAEQAGWQPYEFSE